MIQSHVKRQFGLFDAVAVIDSSEDRLVKGSIADVSRPDQRSNGTEGL